VSAPVAAEAARHSGRLSPPALVGGVLLALVVLASVLAPLLASSDPVKPSFSRRLAPPWGLGGTPAHVLGTDNLGRDILARVLHGDDLPAAQLRCEGELIWLVTRGAAPAQVAAA